MHAFFCFVGECEFVEAFVVDGMLGIVEVVGEEFVTPAVEFGVRGDHEEFGRVDCRLPD